MDESTLRVIKAIGFSVAAPIGVYLLIFQHFSCETNTEQFTAAILGFAGIGAAVKGA